MDTRLREVSILYPEFSSCGASFLLKNRVPPPICLSYYPGWRLHHLHIISLGYSSVYPRALSINSVAVAVNLGAR